MRLDTLWSTSAKAEQQPRQAIQNMPPLPPTPTGEPLVFEKTISFLPFDADVPPIYKDDCLPDPPAYRNPFAWDGQSPQVRARPVVQPAKALDPQALAECLKQLPPDTIRPKPPTTSGSWSNGAQTGSRGLKCRDPQQDARRPP